MTIAYIYGGPLKRDIIKRAYGLCGQATTDFELTPEEYQLGLQAMNDIAPTLGSIPFNYTDYGVGTPEDESGLAPDDVLGFTVMVAQEIAPNIGKTYSPNGLQANAKSSLRSKYQAIPRTELGRGAIRGAGNRLWQGASPFFFAPVSDEEPQQ